LLVVQDYFRKGWFLRVLAGKYGVTQLSTGWGFRQRMDESLLKNTAYARARRVGFRAHASFKPKRSPIQAYIWLAQACGFVHAYFETKKIPAEAGRFGGVLVGYIEW
jgi:hypothetical protein